MTTPTLYRAPRRVLRLLLADTLSGPTCAVIGALALSLGCVTTPSPAASRIREADDQMVAGCTYVGEVAGASGIQGMSDIAIQNAKTEALEQAARLRATHIVWNALVAGKQSSVSGKAYVCPGSTASPRRP